MKTGNSNSKSLKRPIVKINKNLDKFSNMVLFPEKVARANEMLKKVGLPKFKFVK
jgi:hypothetical protein